ncbi:TrmH family RNA methyltransferase [Nibricoccus sp. IMCC34717]|uniref:TrmH family RNA methyltransferase n=1 Tax=Nibricoccus sp. IMCC34717 TaxID=3034021 RepID=UPI00384A9E0E
MLRKSDLQRLRSLREKKHREELGLYVVEGAKVVAELLRDGVELVELYATDAWNGPRDARVVAVTNEEMARLSHFPTPSPVLAVGRLVRPALEPGELDRGLTLAADAVQDAGNVGTLLRIADWFGFARVLLSPECADVFSQKVINASMGSFARVRVVTAVLPVALAGVSVPVIGCDLAGKNVYSLNGYKSAVLVVGSEGRGLSPGVAAVLTQRVTIPRLGRAESLNAGVAAGIVCAQLCRTP